MRRRSARFATTAHHLAVDRADPSDLSVVVQPELATFFQQPADLSRLASSAGTSFPRFQFAMPGEPDRQQLREAASGGLERDGFILGPVLGC